MSNDHRLKISKWDKGNNLLILSLDTSKAQALIPNLHHDIRVHACTGQGFSTWVSRHWGEGMGAWV